MLVLASWCILLSSKNGITRLGVIGIALSTVIGSGVWKDSLLWSNSAGFFSLLAVFVGWLLMMTVGFSYAECVGMFPQGGGPYSYVGGAFGKRAGAFTGLLFFGAYCFIGAILSFLTSLFALGALSYPTFVLLTTPNIVILTAILIVVIGLFAGITPTRKFGFIALGWVILKIVLVLGVFAFLFLSWTGPTGVVPSLNGLQSAVNNSIWALLGFELMLVFSGDMDKPEKDMPRSILLTLPVFLIVYFVVALAASGRIAIGAIPSGTGTVGLLAMLASMTGVYGGLIFAFAAISAAGTAYAILGTMARQASILAADGHLPAFLNKEKSGVKMNAGLVTTILVLIVGVVMTATMDVWTTSVDMFAAAGIGLVLISAMLPAGLTALYLRMKMPAISRPYKAPLHIVTFGLAVLLSLYLLYLNFADVFAFWPAILISLIVIVLVLVANSLFRTKQ